MRRRSVALKIGFILARSFTLTSFALFIDTLRLASGETDRPRRVNADWAVLSTSRKPIFSSCGIPVSPTILFSDPAEFDYLVIVGGPLSKLTAVDSMTFSYLRDAAAKGVPLVGICTGTFILAQADLLRGHETCVSWHYCDDFRRRFPELQVSADRTYSLEAARGSCAGGIRTADLAAELVRRHIGEAAERNALAVLQIDEVPGAESAASRRPRSTDASDPRVVAALGMMERNLEQTLTIAELAAALGISRRQLERLFLNEVNSSPAVMYKRVRLERAKQLLKQGDALLIDVAVEVGFETVSHFGRAFRKMYGETPTTWRKNNPPQKA
ncbi:GlxA family transcriptional regulator [Ensifer sp. BR816]|uniref:GlxA family transcriptional regulator n=1 Tax=Rhizobium sp. (strain BR816) TaxID=1057002 RepID=UPI0003703C57|nr:GlxA family transcriptional regulator [Ensifer sp. BR816]